MLPPLLQPSKVSCFLATGHAAHSGALLWSSVDLEGGGRMLARCTGRILWSWNWYHVVVFFLSRGTDGHPGYSCCHQQRARGEHTWARFRPHLLQQFLPAVSVSVLQQPLQLPAVLHGLGCWLLCWGRGKSPWGLPCEEQPPEPPSALHAWPSRKPVAGRLLPREVTGCLKPHTCTYTQTSTRVHHYAKRVESFHSTHYTIFRHWLKGIVKKKKHTFVCILKCHFHTWVSLCVNTQGPESVTEVACVWGLTSSSLALIVERSLENAGLRLLGGVTEVAFSPWKGDAKWSVCLHGRKVREELGHCWLGHLESICVWERRSVLHTLRMCFWNSVQSRAFSIWGKTKHLALSGDIYSALFCSCFHHFSHAGLSATYSRPGKHSIPRVD